MEQFDDDVLIGLAVGGDGPALATLLAEYEPRLLHYARRRLSEKVRLTAAPEDVVQQTCLEATRLISKLEPKGRRKFYAWLLRIEHHRIQEAVRKHLQRVKLGVARGFDDDASVIGAIEELAVYRRTPSRSAAAHEFIAAVERSLAAMPERYRRTVTLRHVEGLSVEETAARLCDTPANVRRTCDRALASLRKLLISESRFA
jgi:RNA polymerase sigma-70 factor (ECF subfamily)